MATCPLIRRFRLRADYGLVCEACTASIVAPVAWAQLALAVEAPPAVEPSKLMKYSCDAPAEAAELSTMMPVVAQHPGAATFVVVKPLPDSTGVAGVETL